MGLDMYLSKKTYVKYWEHNGNKNYKIEVSRFGVQTAIDPKRISYIIEEVCYWRKANHIHKWFVDNVQNGEDNCGSYHVSREKLEQLLQTCKEVVADPSRAQSFLPTQSGFFFGRTDYDEYYMGDVIRTIEILEKVLEEEDGDFEYSSSW